MLINRAEREFNVNLMFLFILFNKITKSIQLNVKINIRRIFVERILFLLLENNTFNKIKRRKNTFLV